MWPFSKHDDKKNSEEFSDDASVASAFKNAKELGLSASSASAAPSYGGASNLPPPPSAYNIPAHLDDN